MSNEETFTKQEVIDLLQRKREQYKGNPEMPVIYIIAEIESELGLV